jgi:uncharacterized protein
VLLLVMAAGASRCTSGPSAPVDSRPYEERIAAARAQKDADFRASDNDYSPIPLDKRAVFPSLVYYPIRPEYRVPAALTEVRSDPPIVIELPNSARQIERKVKVGTLTFTLAGTSHTLSAFAENAGSIQRLWVPFRDLTSGLETYGGGRYMDLDRTPTGLYDLDFNRAYLPYCVYNPGFVCPYPPDENRLPIAVRAGERMPETQGE